MQSRLVMTLIGKDRPGLVDALAATVADHGGNWVESRMCRLGGEFAGVMRVEIAADAVSTLTTALEQLDSQGLRVVVCADEESSPENATIATIELVGQDRPGLLREISRVLAAHQINVEDLQTERSSAPMSGEMLFQATMEVSVGANSDTAALRASLEKIAADLMVEIKFEEGR